MSRPNRYRNNPDDSERKQGKSHHGLALLILVMLAGVAGWFWLARDPQMRETVLAQISRTEHAVIDALSGLLNRNATPPPPPNIGAVAGSSIPGAPPLYDTIKTPEQLDKALAEPRQPQTNGPEERGEVARDVLVPPDAGRKDDPVVRIAFIDDVAAWLVGHYTPSASGKGKISASLQAANHRYGVNMQGLAWIGEDLPAGRATALGHVFTPGMLDALYKLYADRFMEAVARSAGSPLPDGKQLAPAQQTDFYRQYAQAFRGLSGVLHAIASTPDFTRQMQALRDASQRVVSTNARYSELTFALDQARESKDMPQVSALRTQMSSLGREYQQAVVARERTQAGLVQLLKKNSQTRGMDTDSLLFIAAWVERRLHETPEKIQAVNQAAALFQNLAQRFDEAAGSAGATR